ncbi:hypothetical protein [Paenibacillus humicola]|uniref:hypothetical protein n=1 Tax=Paenibacillus humicola TaxID=3110540 RepID=UPI00237B7076|nr:hypothetical protein [Paenibacillus humicola]
MEKSNDKAWYDQLGEKVNPVVKESDGQPGVNGIENAEHPTRDPNPNAMFGEVFDETLKNVQDFFQDKDDEKTNE